MLERFFKLPDWLQHALFAALVMVATGLIWTILLGSNGHWAGALAGIALYYGREHRDAENADPSLYDNPKSLAFWKWRKDQLTDFLAPLAGNTGLALLAEFLT